ncbi:MAG: LUD domain-containing protein [Pirellulaceae bacterium]|nr:LUD domain-containing protein [Pirellulaceae bacterium]
MTNTRDQLLRNLRRQLVPQVALPEVVDGPWITFDQPLEKLAEVLKFVGGTCVRVENVGQIEESLKKFPQYQSAKRIFSAVDGLAGNVQIDHVENAHDLEDLDFVIYPGQFAVAENGAVWVTDQQLKHRVVFFITQYLVLVLSERDVLDNMHQAYARAVPPQPGFGLFLSGPSKTADIEQSLVIGAHGCRQMQLYLLP